MRKYRVGTHLDFRIDYDASSGGFWLDAGEYDILKSHNIHDELHLICSHEYQLRLAQLESTASQHARFHAILSEETCTKIERLLDSLDTDNQRAVASAYMQWLIEERSNDSTEHE